MNERRAEARKPAALTEHLPPLSENEAAVEANRCLYCYDAPCTHACPTHIDIPRFIKKIATGNLTGSARAIFEENLLGATCARVCPVQELCEGACVLGSEHKPIMIGRLQRYAMDHAYAKGLMPFHPPAASGKKIAVVGAGPAGLSCAGELRRFGHEVTIFEKRELPGGLSTYGIIVLREPIDIAIAEAQMVERLGITLRPGSEFGQDLSADDLSSKFDAIFLGIGLGTTPEMHIPGEEYILDGLAYIAQSKLDLSKLPKAQHAVVIGAGNTAIDCATIARRLGAGRVTIVYRRSESEMTAYDHEYEFIKLEGVEFRFFTQPVRVLHDNVRVRGLECVGMKLGARDASGRPAPQVVPDSTFILSADQVIKAIGQTKPPVARMLNLDTEKGFIKVDANYETTARNVFAGGDCVRSSGAASTVMAVEDGKLAARAIHKRLMNGGASEERT